MKTKEQKLADEIANSVEDHWFNSAIVAHMLADQPYYTIDRVMEILAHIIKFGSKRYKRDWEKGSTSEGLFLANELNEHLQMLSKKYKWDNVNLPKSTKDIIASLPEPTPGNGTKHSWLHEPERDPFSRASQRI